MGAFRLYNGNQQRTSFESKNEDDHLNINSHRFGLIAQSRCSKNSKADDGNGPSMLGLPFSGNQEPKLINIDLNLNPYFEINPNQPPISIPPPKVVMPVPVVLNPESAGVLGGEGAGPFSMIAVHSNLNSFPPGPAILKPDEPGFQKECFHCKKTETPCWRKGPRGTKTLCNACGLRFSRKKLRWNPWL